MDYYLNLINTIGIHTLLGLSAYLLILTGQVVLILEDLLLVLLYIFVVVRLLGNLT